MKGVFTVAASTLILLAGCHTARTQNEPQVIHAPAPVTQGPASTSVSEVQPTPMASPMMTPVARAASKAAYNSCNVDGPYIAITFDDGPHPVHTPKLLDMLKARGIKATFYVVGQCVVQHPEIVRRMVEEGHEVANHSWNHPALTKLSADGVRKQIEDTNEAIIKACGVRPVTMRPPYGATNAALDRRMDQQFGLKVILWSVDPQDWKYRNSQRVADQIINGTKPGAIVLAHDIHPSTVNAMPQTLDALTAKGYKFVTVSELIAMDRPPQPKPSATPSATPAPTVPMTNSTPTAISFE